METRLLPAPAARAARSGVPAKPHLPAGPGIQCKHRQLMSAEDVIPRAPSCSRARTRAAGLGFPAASGGAGWALPSSPRAQGMQDGLRGCRTGSVPPSTAMGTQMLRTGCLCPSVFLGGKALFIALPFKAGDFLSLSSHTVCL